MVSSSSMYVTLHISYHDYDLLHSSTSRTFLWMSLGAFPAGATERLGDQSEPGWWRAPCAFLPPRGLKARPSRRCSRPPARHEDRSITISPEGSPNCCMRPWTWLANEVWRRWRPPVDSRQRASLSAFSPYGAAFWTGLISRLDALSWPSRSPQTTTISWTTPAPS